MRGEAKEEAEPCSVLKGPGSGEEAGREWDLGKTLPSCKVWKARIQKVGLEG